VSTSWMGRTREVLPPAVGSPTCGGVRHERKYLVAAGDAERIAALLRTWMPPDGHAPGGAGSSYTVRSLYFDTPDLACYRAKVDGIARRHKLRLRAYGDQPGAPVRLELKERSGQVYRKRRVWLSDADLALLRDRVPLDGEPVEPGDDLVRRLRVLMERRGYAPSVLVAYEREAYTESSGDDTVRITLDRDVRARAYPVVHELVASDGFATVLTRSAILEVKFTDVVPLALRQLTARFALQRRACSKYASSVARVIGANTPPREAWVHVRGN